MLAMGLAVVFLGLGVLSFALGARGGAGVSLQAGRTLFLLFLGLSVASLLFYALA